jgi:hypothetical protein
MKSAANPAAKLALYSAKGAERQLDSGAGKPGHPHQALAGTSPLVGEAGRGGNQEITIP